MTDEERAKAVSALQAELHQLADQLTEVRPVLKRRCTKFQTSQAKVWRDGIGAGAGMVFAGPTSGYSLLLSFWTMTSLVVDLLDVKRERQAIYELKDRLGGLLRRQTDIEAEIERLAAPTENPVIPRRHLDRRRPPRRLVTESARRAAETAA